jgi:hypothetical protein
MLKNGQNLQIKAVQFCSLIFPENENKKPYNRERNFSLDFENKY